MHSRKIRLSAVLLGGALITGALSVPVHAKVSEATSAEQVRTVQAEDSDATRAQSLAEIARTLPKVGPSDVLKLAESQIGIRENSLGGGTKFHEWYMSTDRARETVARDGGAIHHYANAPWCDMFVSWVGNQLGIGPVMGSDAYTVEHAKWFAEHGRWGKTPEPGAVVFFGWSGGDNIYGIDHVGFVVRDNGDGTIETIEGNTGNGAVEQRTRSKYHVVGYGYPLYTAP